MFSFACITRTQAACKHFKHRDRKEHRTAEMKDQCQKPTAVVLEPTRIFPEAGPILILYESFPETSTEAGTENTQLTRHQGSGGI